MSKSPSQCNYQLVILGEPWDLYHHAYADLIEAGVPYYSGFLPEGKFERLMFRIHTSRKIARYVTLPGKQIWVARLLRNLKLEEGAKPVFLFLRSWWSIEPDLKVIDTLRKLYPGCKTVLFMQDMARTYMHYGTHIPLSVEEYKRKFDLIISFAQSDAEHYGIEFHNTVLSSAGMPEIDEIDIDLLFLGANKGRLPLLARLYEKFTARGLRCRIMLVNVPEEERILEGKIEYLESSLTYTEALKLAARSRCLLEILQDEAAGATYRTLEAIAMNKKLVTNNAALPRTGLYDAAFVSIFKDADDADIAFVENEDEPFLSQNPLVAKISPVTLADFIAEKLGIKLCSITH